MRSTFTFGSYVPGASALHRLDPRTKLLLGIAFLVLTLQAHDFAGLAPATAAVLALYACARITPAKAIRALAPTLGIVVLVSLLRLFTQQGGTALVSWGIIQISTGSLHAATLTAARITLMMMGMSLVTMTTPTLDLTEGLERLLSPLARLGVPAHELGMIAGIALRFVPQLVAEMQDIRMAQTARGARLAGSPVRGVRQVSSVAVPLMAGVFRHAETLSEAMDARCYHGQQGRTSLRPLKLHGQDAVAVLAYVALLVATLAINATC